MIKKIIKGLINDFKTDIQAIKEIGKRANEGKPIIPPHKWIRWMVKMTTDKIIKEKSIKVKYVARIIDAIESRVIEGKGFFNKSIAKEWLKVKKEEEYEEDYYEFVIDEESYYDIDMAIRETKIGDFSC